MTDIDHATWSEVASLIRPAGRLVDASRLPGGLSSVMTVLEIDDGAPIRVVVRRHRLGRQGSSLPVADEYRLIECVGRLGLPVPRPILIDTSTQILDQPYAVYEYVEGAPRLERSEPSRVGRVMADQLAAIHRLGGDPVARMDLPSRADIVEQHLGSRPALPDHSLREDEIRSALQAHRGRLPDGRCLLHGDYWPGNVLWDAEGRAIVAVIDWEDASIGDPLADVGTTRLDLLWAFGPEAVDAFTEQYLETTATDPSALPIWDLVAALRPAGELSVWAADWADFGRSDVTSTAMRAAHGAFLDRALAALDGSSGAH